MSSFASYCRKAVPEGIVLLENNGTLPLHKKEKIALFGRGQVEYLKGGSGSGGRVNCPYVTTIKDCLKRETILDSVVSGYYEKWIKENVYDAGNGWQLPTHQQEPMLTEEFVAQAAQRNDTAILILYRMVGESYDLQAEKGSWYLTDEEENAIALLSKSFKRFVVLVNSAGIIDMSWVKRYNVGAVAYIWGGGQEGGRGTVDMLMGRTPPSGRLTDTIAKCLEDYPAHGCFGDGVKNVHKEDIFVGYRYFETFAKDAVLYPFGYGLGYTKFTQTVLFAQNKGGRVALKVLVKNIGDDKGKDVVQVYYSAPQGVLGKPARELVAFKKTRMLRPGQEQTLTLSFDVSQMASYDDAGKTQFPYAYVLEEGTYHIYVGANVREAEEAFALQMHETVCVRQCSQAMAPIEEFERMTVKDGALAYEKAPLRPSLRYEIPKEDLKEIAYTGDRGITLQQVKSGEYSLDDFIAQFTAEELGYLAKGEGMSSPKAPIPGTASSFGGVAKLFFDHGVPVVSTCDGPAGLRIECDVPTTNIPMGTMLACAWAPELFERMFKCFAEEMLRYHIDVNLGPGLNIHRHPLCGRNFEYFSEDPYVTGRYAMMIAKALFEQGVYCTLKHFAVNSQEYNRGSENEVVSERALREIYLKGFEMAVRSGYVRSIMTSYNRINGVGAPGNYDLVTKVLRGEWGYTGFVMTDWWSCIDDFEKGTFTIKNLTAMIEAQTDVFMPVPDAVHYDDDIKENVANGRLPLAKIQRVAKNVLSFVLQSHAFSRGQEAFQENDFSQLKDSIFETQAVQNGGVVCPNVPAGTYVAELVYNTKGDVLAQMNIRIFVDKKDAIILVVNETNGEDAVTKCRVVLSENTSLWIEGEGVKSLKLMQVR